MTSTTSRNERYGVFMPLTIISTLATPSTSLVRFPLGEYQPGSANLASGVLLSSRRIP